MDRQQSASPVPVDIDPFKNQGLVVQLQDDEQKDQEQHHENSHHGRGAPARHDFAVLRIEGTEQIAQTSALSLNGAWVSGEVQSRYCRGPDPEEVDPVERCDGKFLTCPVRGDCSSGCLAWPHRFRGLHSLRSTVETPGRSI